MQVLNAFKNQIHHNRCQAHGGLIKQQKPRGRSQAAGNRQHLLLAARECSGQLVAALCQHRKQRKITLQVAAPVGTPFGGRRTHLQVFKHSQVAEHLAALRHVGNAQMGPILGRQFEQIFSFKHDAAGIGNHLTRDGFKQRRLASAVGADDGNKLSFVHLDRHAIQGANHPITCEDAFKPQHGASPSIFSRDRP